MRIAIIERDKCTNKECGYVCHKVCPGVRMGDETVTVGPDDFPIISEALCTGCGICVKKCPAKCIKVINLAEEKGGPIFQYGENAFRLYGLPLPQKGVVGLIGKNGIGKSTALKLLSGNLAPNFGDWKRKWADEEIAGKLGLEARAYFRGLHDKRMRVAYKPQNVDRISGMFFGKCRELLEKTADPGAEGRSSLDDAIRIFELGSFIDRKVAQVSGGELQRLAIAAAWLKDADIYYFDEPASYLDIEQRLKIGNALKELGEKKPVIVVEHDIALFDYLSDYVYVFYGEENAYGIVSNVKAVRTGINEYLSGYLKDENVRFRDSEIRFMAEAEGERFSKTKVEYGEMAKRFANFSFRNEAGSLRQGEIVGIVGKNAIGKSLFVKMLAGVEMPDSGKDGYEERKAKFKVSYKPQYIKAEESITVGELFMANRLVPTIFEEAKRRLNVGGLLERKLQHLSGGELQRVAITLALSMEADLYLFDEPSAFLDIEQRLHFAHLLRNVIENSEKCAFVVDHDVVLIDSVSNRLMVFDGESGKKGHANSPEPKRGGMNRFLKGVQVTLRRDKDSNRPRINKPGSALDREQKESGEYYYTKKE